LTRRGLVDIGLVYGALVIDDDLEVEHLFDEELALASPPGFALDLPPSAGPLRQLPADLPLIVFPRGYALRRVVERATGGRPDIRAEVETLDLMVKLAEQQVGACVLPRPALPASGPLMVHPLMGDAFRRQVVLITRPGGGRTAAAGLIAAEIRRRAETLR
jgi:DNA-binding transcriptional LysR family regulator